MKHPISDALTAQESRWCSELLETAIVKHDRRGNTRELLRDIRAVAQFMDGCAHSVPEDAGYPGRVPPVDHVPVAA